MKGSKTAQPRVPADRDERAVAAALDRIADAEDPKALRRYMDNARRIGSEPVWRAAFRRLAAVSAGEAAGEEGSIERDYWVSVHAAEQTLEDDRGRTARLSSARRKVARVGAAQMLADIARAAAPSAGFVSLTEGDMAELTAEAVVLRHADAFEPPVVEAAEGRLAGAGCDLDALKRAH